MLRRAFLTAAVASCFAPAAVVAKPLIHDDTDALQALLDRRVGVHLHYGRIYRITGPLRVPAGTRLS